MQAFPQSLPLLGRHIAIALAQLLAAIRRQLAKTIEVLPYARLFIRRQLLELAVAIPDRLAPIVLQPAPSPETLAGRGARNCWWRRVSTNDGDRDRREARSRARIAVILPMAAAPGPAAMLRVALQMW